MKLKLLVITGCFYSLLSVSSAFAGNIGVNCDATTPVLQPGTAEWKACYMKSSIDLCNAKYTYQRLQPSCGCNQDCLDKVLKQNYTKMRSQVCGYEAHNNFLPSLPTPVTEHACEVDWGCYIGQASCNA